MRINLLELATANLDKMRSFYADLLQLPIMENSTQNFSVQCGRSSLGFVKRDKSTPSHFAFNIPFLLVADAMDWLGKRVPIIEYCNKRIISFPKWKAKAIYFHDPDSNIVEFIGREEIAARSFDSFSEECILSISEVGLATRDIEKVHDALNAIKPIQIYDGSYESFCALGDPEGLFIVVNYNRKRWFPTDDIIQPSDLVLEGDYSLIYQGEKVCPF